MEYTLTIPGRLEGLNNYIGACRYNKFFANHLKRNNDDAVRAAIREQLNGVEIKKMVDFEIYWYEPNARRDPDNIVSAKKYILDALVKEGVLANDSQKYVRDFCDHVRVDKENPRIVIKIKEVS